LGSDRSIYTVLGIAPDATFSEIRRSYRAAMKAVHPDVVDGREEEAKQLTAAYASVSDPIAPDAPTERTTRRSDPC
jgi:DnaJ-class molecular chaperone